MFEKLSATRLGWFGKKPSSERRLHNRAKAVWHATRRGRAFPTPDDFGAQQIDEVLEHGFLLEIRPKEAPLVGYAGAILCEEAELDSVPISLAMVSKSSLLGQFGWRWEQVVEACEPMTSEYEFTTEAGYKVSCRGILLPLARDGKCLDHIFGVVNWKSKKLSAGAHASTSAESKQRR